MIRNRLREYNQKTLPVLQFYRDKGIYIAVDGTAGIDEMGERIFRLMLETASGRATKSEQHGYGQNEFVPWALGATM